VFCQQCPVLCWSVHMRSFGPSKTLTKSAFIACALGLKLKTYFKVKTGRRLLLQLLHAAQAAKTHYQIVKFKLFGNILRPRDTKLSYTCGLHDRGTILSRFFPIAIMPAIFLNGAHLVFVLRFTCDSRASNAFRCVLFSPH
jgi:hypothetical protein